ncbi:hypothetical protein Pmar_PMAR014804 [Perkinsus marinus ATCC 50983]|uniref:Uncharacterized protein n=1 Tax=Perkinsus marinus (strain ATCC 50983 / TXsc) TaxID=423536 RepID=C5LT00_PERM5|nr:hypothetical protein Pmar_PMAR014804 [Perkinsus marinus ATCC 50983]EER00137.1 hypothetical protein Pmar_PMAR014804 [Perkinsus marinus ATCC 50983]|eukprot:XP_002767419.1 hypothetical protein Pmar_PMAR014804 [Perkinsus marinus ATCC 50983]
MAPELVNANGGVLRSGTSVNGNDGKYSSSYDRRVMSESKDRAAFMMINEAKARMSDKPVPAIIKGLLEVDPSKRLTCCDAYYRLNKHKGKENSIIDDAMHVKPLKDYFGNYDILGDTSTLQELRRFYHLLEMTNPTTIKAALSVDHHTLPDPNDSPLI